MSNIDIFIKKLIKKNHYETFHQHLKDIHVANRLHVTWYIPHAP